jgi:2-keto-4-pentenoate hydratase
VATSSIIGAQRVKQCSEYLIECRRRRLRPRGLPSDIAPRDLDEAYRIQLAVARHRGITIGFKVGITSAEAQRATGATAPIVGRLASPDIVWGHKRTVLGEQHLRIAEAEVVFEIGEDLACARAPFSQEQIARSVSGAFAGIEICDSRFSDVDAVPLVDIVADNSNADLLIVGPRLSEADLQSLENLPVTLMRSGKNTVAGCTARVLGHPLASLTWLANWLAARGEGLKRGQLIASGSCTGITEFAASDVLVATFGVDTAVVAEFAPENSIIEVKQ